MKMSSLKARLNDGAGRYTPPVVFDQRPAINFFDAPQAGLGFVISQLTHIEREVNEVKYPTVQYPELIPVDTSAPEWAPTVTYYSSDKTGQAQFIDSAGMDIPNAEIKREKFTTAVHMAGIGYHYTLEEINQAAMLGMSLPNEKAMSARRAAEEFIDTIALTGDSSVNFTGLLNNASVDVENVPNDGTGSSRLFTAKTATLILRDLNEALTEIHTESKTTEMADTLLLPWETLHYLSTTERASGSDMTILEFFRRNNVYTLTTNNPLMIRGVRGLETAGDSSTKRMIAYHRDPSVLKLHMPMPHRFMAPFQKSAMQVEVPGIFRLGGLDIRRPGAVRYRDGF